MKYICCILFLILSLSSHAQKLMVIGDLPEVLKGSSGLETTRGGELWTINDHGNPVLYKLNPDSATIARTIYLNNNIKDWEALTTDTDGNFYIGDFGNNRNDRRNLVIYKIPDPDNIKQKVVTADLIRFQLSDQKDFPPKRKDFEFDIEAMVHYGNALYLFTKSRGIPFKGLVKIYKVPDDPGNHIAKMIGSTNLGGNKQMENWITGAAVDEINKVLVLLSHNRMFIFSCFQEDRFFDGRRNNVNFNHFSQKEAVSFAGNRNEFYITDEKNELMSGGKLYFIRIEEELVRCR